MAEPLDQRIQMVSKVGMEAAAASEASRLPAEEALVATRQPMGVLAGLVAVLERMALPGLERLGRVITAAMVLAVLAVVAEVLVRSVKSAPRMERVMAAMVETDRRIALAEPPPRTPAAVVQGVTQLLGLVALVEAATAGVAVAQHQAITGQ